MSEERSRERTAAQQRSGEKMGEVAEIVDVEGAVGVECGAGGGRGVGSVGDESERGSDEAEGGVPSKIESALEDVEAAEFN